MVLVNFMIMVTILVEITVMSMFIILVKVIVMFMVNLTHGHVRSCSQTIPEKVRNSRPINMGFKGWG